MLTGTPLDLTPFGPLLSLLGVAYWLLAFGLAAIALWLPRSWRIKLPLSALVIAGFIYPVIRHTGPIQKRDLESRPRFDEATALFKKRCQAAGEKITKNVTDVDGVVWMKWRGESEAGESAKTKKVDDPYGNECDSEACIYRLLRATLAQNALSKPSLSDGSGYKFVETTDPRDGQRYRYQIDRQ